MPILLFFNTYQFTEQSNQSQFHSHFDLHIWSTPYHRFIVYNLSVTYFQDSGRARYRSSQSLQIIINLTLNCLLVLRFNVPVNNFSVMSGRSVRFLGFNQVQYSGELICLAQGHNMLTLSGIKPKTSRFGGRSSTTRPPRSLTLN